MLQPMSLVSRFVTWIFIGGEWWKGLISNFSWNRVHVYTIYVVNKQFTIQQNSQNVFPQS